MAKPTLESLQQELQRQDRELAELMDHIAGLGPCDVPKTFFEELDAICEPKLAWSAPVTTFHAFGLRA